MFPSIGDVQLTEPIAVDASPAFCNGTVLVPWPNRVRDARWNYQGRELRLDITEPARGNALHGLLQFTEHEVRERSDESVTLGVAVAPSTAGRSSSTPGCASSCYPTGSR